MKIQNRVTEITGTDYPIIQAPMGWIARAQLASAVSNAGGMGIIETSSGEFDNIKLEVEKMRDLTDKPFGMNVALSYVKGQNFIDFVIDQGIKFVTTSSGSPKVCTAAFQEAGIKVFHVVPTLAMAEKAIEAGVDGLVVEGGEGELAASGPGMFLGYADAQQTREAHTADGYFLTGDIGRITGDGALVITDRKKDLIIRGGENLSAKEIENVLHFHQAA